MPLPKPQSIPGGWNKDSPMTEEKNPIDLQTFPRGAAGVVGESGDIFSKAGKSIGKLSGSKGPQGLSGNAVTAAGDVVDSSGKVLGKAALSDAKNTTQSSQKDGKSSQGLDLAGKTKSSHQTADKLQRPVSKGLNFVSGQRKPSEDEVSTGDFVKHEEGNQSQQKSSANDPDKTQDVEEKGTSTDQNIGKVISMKDEEKEKPSEAEPHNESPVDQGDEGDESQTTSAKKDEDKSQESVVKTPDESTLDTNHSKDDSVETDEKKTTDDTVKNSDEPTVDEKVKDEVNQSTPDKGEETTPKDDAAKRSLESKADQDVSKKDDSQENNEEGKSKANTVASPGELEPDKPVGKEDDIQEDKEKTQEDDAVKTSEEQADDKNLKKENVSQSNLEDEDAEKPKDELPKGTDESIIKPTEVDPSPKDDPRRGPTEDVESPAVPEGEPAKSAETSESKDLSEKDAGEVAVNVENDAKEGDKEEGDKQEVEQQEDEKKEVEPQEVEQQEGDKDVEPQEEEQQEGDKKDVEPQEEEQQEGDKDVEPQEEEQQEGEKEGEQKEEMAIDYSCLKGTKVNKAGNLVNSNGEVVGRIVEGDVKKLVGKKADEEGKIWNDAGKVVGQGEPLPDSEREDLKEFAPFENFPDAVVEGDGRVLSNGRQVGTVVQGDPKRLKGSRVDEDGDIIDRRGNVVGKAEAWDEPEAEPEAPEPEVDRSILAGKRVNKSGNVVDSSGTIFGKVVEGDIKALKGRMCDKEGNVRSESGDIIGKAEVVPEGEREGLREGPFAELSGCTVAKDGTVVTPSGDVVGRLVTGDPKTLFGRPVDEDGDVVDKNGNVLAKAERWEKPEVQKKANPLTGRKLNREGNVLDEDDNVIARLISGDIAICAGKEIDDDGDVINSKGNSIGHVALLEDIPPEVEEKYNPLAGRRVNREGNVVDEDGNVIAKLVSGDISVCSGKEVDGDGDVINSKGNSIGHVALLEDIAPEQTESPEDKEKREQAEQDRKLAQKLAGCIEQALDKIRPICKMINDKIDTAERTPKEKLDEEQLVKEVKPLIEEGGKILTETNGSIRGLDPDGRIQRNAKHKSGTKEASPEEYHLADVLKELTGTVTQCIDQAKRKIEGMPHAKKELNPLWGLLSEPLFQIIAAVGLLLTGVLNLVGRLLNGLGLGGLVDSLLGGLGLNKLLEGLGLGSAVSALTGGKDKGKKKGGGLLGGIL